MESVKRDQAWLSVMIQSLRPTRTQVDLEYKGIAYRSDGALQAVTILLAERDDHHDRSFAAHGGANGGQPFSGGL
jgi:hypothetical protein